jgi:hypothetical protein
MRRTTMGIATREDTEEILKSTTDILGEEVEKRKKGKKTQDGPRLHRGEKTQDPRPGK